MSRSTSRGRQSRTGPPDSTVGNLRPAVFPTAYPHGEPSSRTNQPFLNLAFATRPTSRSPPDATPSRPVSPYSLGIIDDNTSGEDEVHFTLMKSIDPSKFNHLFHLKPRLTATNYSTWTSTTSRALQTVGLHIYLDPDFGPEDMMDNKNHYIRWNKANSFVSSVLTACMTEEIQNQIGHLSTAAEIWSEA